MSTERDVLHVAFEIGQKIMMSAHGDPARTLAYGVAAAVATTGVVIGYGSYKYGCKAVAWLSE